jgi:hypothetical protein
MVKRRKEEDESWEEEGEEEEEEEDEDEEYEEEEVIRAPKRERKLPSPPRQKRTVIPAEVAHLTDLVGNMKKKVKRRLISVKDSVSRLQVLIEENKRRGLNRIQQISSSFERECSRRIATVSVPSIHTPSLHPDAYPYSLSPQLSPYPAQPVYYLSQPSIQMQYAREDSDDVSPFNSPMSRYSASMPSNQGLVNTAQLADFHTLKFSPHSPVAESPHSPHSPLPLYPTTPLPLPAAAPILTHMGTPVGYLFGMEPVAYPAVLSFAERLEDMEKSTRENVQKLENFLLDV